MRYKKLALITLHSVKNYGSVLQTYASQCYFEMLGYDVVVIDFRRKWETKIGYWMALPHKNVRNVMRQIVYTLSKFKQKKIFDRFLIQRINRTTCLYKNEEDFVKHPVEADVYCTGSDQVWNSGWNDGVIPPYYLSFIKNNEKIKKISFAASFGKDSITNDEKELIESFLSDYDFITVREKGSVQMLREQFGIEAKEIYDPTLQMTAEFWRSLKKDYRIKNDGYILLIQLNRDKKFDDYAVEYAEYHKKRLVRLCLRVDQLLLPGEHILLPEVEQYIALIDNASCVLTDSFHATSFCINLNKQFFCYYPENYSTRLSSILSLLDLTDRKIEYGKTETVKDIDYDRVNDVLNKRRIETDMAIKASLS